MMAWIQRRPLVAVLALAAIVLLVVIGLETGFGGNLRPAIPEGSAKKAAAPEAKLLPPMVAVSPEQAYAETAARPLWTPTRRPAPPDNTAARPAFTRGQFVLQGVIVVGDERTALLKEKATGKIHRLESGKEVNGITVEAIQPTEVTLAMGGEKEKVALVVQRAEGSAPGARTAATPAPESAQGPFGPMTAPQASGAPPVPPPAGSVDPSGAPVGTLPGGRPANPVGRPGTATAPAAPQSTTQPMTPEELLARRRARRNQPTQ